MPHSIFSCRPFLVCFTTLFFAMATHASIYVQSLEEVHIEGKNLICARFSEAIDIGQDFSSYISVQAKDPDDAGFRLASNQSWEIVEETTRSNEVSDAGATNRFICYASTQPKTEYEIEINQGFPSANGEPLQADYFRQLRTRSLEPLASFTSNGSILVPGLSEGIPITAVNVTEVKLDFYRLDREFIDNSIHSIARGATYQIGRTLEHQATLVYSGQYALDLPENTRATRLISTDNIEAIHEQGVYLVAMTRPGNYHDVKYRLFSVSDLGVHARFYGDDIHFHISSLREGTAIEGARVQVYNSADDRLRRVTSNDDGVARFRHPNPRAISGKPAYALITKGDQTSVLNIQSPSLDLSEFDVSGRPFQNQELFLYSPRDLYRPGETVKVSGLLRDQDGRAQPPVALEAELYAPGNQKQAEQRIAAQALGYYESEFHIPSNARTGEWQIRVTKPDEQVETYAFLVEEFLPERLELLFEEEQPGRVMAMTDKLALPIRGNYLYGAPAAGNQVSARVRVGHWRNPFSDNDQADLMATHYSLSDDQVRGLRNFYFGDENDSVSTRTNSLNNFLLNAEGTGVIRSDSLWSQSKSPLRINAEVSLAESGGRPVTRTHSLLAWPQGSLVGIAPQFDDKEVAANTQVEFDLLQLSAGFRQTSVTDVEVRLIRESERYFWQYSNVRGWHYERSSSNYMEHSQQVDLSANQNTRINVPVEWGRYRLEVVDPESHLKTTYSFVAGYRWYWAWRNAQDSSQSIRPDRVVLAWDKEHYQTGDEAVLSMVSPYPGESIVLVESSDELLWSTRVASSGVENEVRIPINRDWDRHDIYVTVISLRPGEKADLQTPNRALGVLHLPLDRANRELAVSLVHPEMAEDGSMKARPNSDFSVQAQVAYQDGSFPQQAKITIAAVDVGVLNITDFETPDAHSWFFEPRAFGINSRDIYNDVIELSDAETARLRFGGDALSRSEKKTEAQVTIQQIFTGLVDVDTEGNAQVDLDLPDFNGRMRLMALAFTEDSYGAADTDLTIAAPLVAEIAMPKFIGFGDQSEFAIDLTNMTEDPITLEAQLKVSDIISLEAQGHQEVPNSAIRLSAGERITLRYRVNASYEAGVADIQLNVASRDFPTIQRNWELEVRAPVPEITRRQPILLNTQTTNQLLDAGLTEGMLESTLQMSLVLSDQFSLQAREQARGLFQYPYGCLEQTSSRIYPWIWLDANTANFLGLEKEELAKQDEAILSGLRRVATMQKSHGGFGYWDAGSAESQWVTVFLAEVLVLLNSRGMVTDTTMLASVNQRLKTYLTRTIGVSRYSQNNDHYQAAYRAYAAYVLAKQNETSLSRVRSLATEVTEHSESPLPLVHLGLAHQLLGDVRGAQALFDQAKNKERSSDRYLGDYGSDVRDLSAVLALYAEHNIEQEQIASIGLYLSELVQSRRYFSTQERAFLMRAALLTQMRNENRGTAIDLFVNAAAEGSESTSESNKGRLSRRLHITGETHIPITAEELASGVRVELSDDEKDWIVGQFQVTAYPEVASETAFEAINDPVDDSGNFAVERFYFDEQGKPIELTELTQGDLVVVHIHVNAESRYQDALVVDLLPAGLELENQNLKHSVKLDQIVIEDQSLAYWMDNNDIEYEEYRDDRYIAAVDLGRRWRSTRLTYLARAVAPGEYLVPPTLVEDMYRPELRTLGEIQPNLVIHTADTPKEEQEEQAQ